MARLVRGDRSHIDGAAQVWAEATAFRDGDPDVAPLEDSRPIIAGVADRPRSVLIVALDDEDQVIAFAVAAPALAVTDDLAGTAEIEYVGVRPGGWGTGLARGVLEQLCAELAADGFTERSYWSTSATGAQLACTNVSAGDRDLVFSTRTGAALDAANVRREFKAVCKAAKIGEKWTPRELRHSFVSLMSSSGLPVEEIARLAGHSSSRTTEVVHRRELRPGPDHGSRSHGQALLGTCASVGILHGQYPDIYHCATRHSGTSRLGSQLRPGGTRPRHTQQLRKSPFALSKTR